MKKLLRPVVMTLSFAVAATAADEARASCVAAESCMCPGAAAEFVVDGHIVLEAGERGVVVDRVVRGTASSAEVPEVGDVIIDPAAQGRPTGARVLLVRSFETFALTLDIDDAGQFRCFSAGGPALDVDTVIDAITGDDCYAAAREAGITNGPCNDVITGCGGGAPSAALLWVAAVGVIAWRRRYSALPMRMNGAQ